MTMYHPIRQSLDGLFQTDCRRRVLVLRAYFDDSGTHVGCPAVVWGGFMAHIDVWAEIEERWAALLRREGLQTFHMKEIENAVGQCDMWSRARRDSVIHDFRAILAASNIVGIGAVVRRSAWSEVIEGTWLEARLGTPALFAFEHAIQLALNLAADAAQQSGISEKVDFVFDLREGEAATAFGLANRYGEASDWGPWFVGASFKRMADTIPLQAADMLAYESYRLENARSKSGAEPDLRAHMEALLRDVPCHGQYYDADALRILASRITQTERPNAAPHDLVSPQGSVPSEGKFTLVERHRLARSLDRLVARGQINLSDTFDRLTQQIDPAIRGEARAFLESYVAGLPQSSV